MSIKQLSMFKSHAKEIELLMFDSLIIDMYFQHFKHVMEEILIVCFNVVSLQPQTAEPLGSGDYVSIVCLLFCVSDIILCPTNCDVIRGLHHLT